MEPHIQTTEKEKITKSIQQHFLCQASLLLLKHEIKGIDSMTASAFGLHPCLVKQSLS